MLKILKDQPQRESWTPPWKPKDAKPPKPNRRFRRSMRPLAQDSTGIKTWYAKGPDGRILMTKWARKELVRRRRKSEIAKQSRKRNR